MTHIDTRTHQQLSSCLADGVCIASLDDPGLYVHILLHIPGSSLVLDTKQGVHQTGSMILMCALTLLQPFSPSSLLIGLLSIVVCVNCSGDMAWPQLGRCTQAIIKISTKGLSTFREVLCVGSIQGQVFNQTLAHWHNKLQLVATHHSF